jgi:hypothetical protein
LQKKSPRLWFNNSLIVRKEYLVSLIQSCVSITEAKYQKYSYILEVTLRNNSSADYVLQNKTNLTYHGHGDLVTIGPHAMTILEVKTLELLTSITLKFSVMNALVAPSTHPDLDFEVSMQLQ